MSSQVGTGCLSQPLVREIGWVWGRQLKIGLILRKHFLTHHDTHLELCEQHPQLAGHVVTEVH